MICFSDTECHSELTLSESSCFVVMQTLTTIINRIQNNLYRCFMLFMLLSHSLSQGSSRKTNHTGYHDNAEKAEEQAIITV